MPAQVEDVVVAVTDAVRVMEEVTPTIAGLAKQAMDAGVTGSLKIIEYVQGEAPELISQLLRWKAVECSLFMAINVLLIIGAYCLMKWLCKLVKEDDDWFPALLFGGSSSIVIGVINMVGLFTHTSSVLQIWVAPKIYILEYLSTLIK